MDLTDQAAARDIALLAAAALGDPAAFELLYDRYERRVYNYVRTFVRQPALADIRRRVAPATAAAERAANGHPAPYRVKYLGLGNESWGCGGPFTADEYVTKMKPFARFVHNQNPDQAPPAIDFASLAKDLMSGKGMDSLPRNPQAMMRVAVGPNSVDGSYTEAVMKVWSTRKPYDRWNIDSLSLHYYTGDPQPMMSPSSGFGEKEYAQILRNTLKMNDMIVEHQAIMDRYDPGKRVALICSGDPGTV